jgi:hypothetical protein
VLEDETEVEVSGICDQGFSAVTDGWLVSSHHFIPLGREGFTILDVTNRPSKGNYIPRQAELSEVGITEGLSKSGDYRRLQWGAVASPKAGQLSARQAAVSAS